MLVFAPTVPLKPCSTPVGRELLDIQDDVDIMVVAKIDDIGLIIGARGVVHGGIVPLDRSEGPAFLAVPLRSRHGRPVVIIRVQMEVIVVGPQNQIIERTGPQGILLRADGFDGGHDNAHITDLDDRPIVADAVEHADIETVATGRRYRRIGDDGLCAVDGRGERHVRA